MFKIFLWSILMHAPIQVAFFPLERKNRPLEDLSYTYSWPLLDFPALPWSLIASLQIFLIVKIKRI